MYLDNAATTVVSKNIIDVVNLYMMSCYGNPSSIHGKGNEANIALQKARDIISGYINSKPEQIVFTSGGSESNTLALIGIAGHLKNLNKTKIITSTIEHPSVLRNLERLENMGFDVVKLTPNSNGVISIDNLKENIDANVGLISIMMVNNEIGTIQDVAAIGNLCKENNILFHTDAVQAVGTVVINVEEMCIDLMSISGHKIHAPKGIGLLYVRNPSCLKPLVYGGGQESELRSGTENTPAIAGFAEAFKDIYKYCFSISDIKQNFVRYLKFYADKYNVEYKFNGDSETNESKIVNIRFPKVDGQTLVMLLSSKGIYVSAGSACHSKSVTPSHVLKSIGLTDEEALSSIRVSFSKYNTNEELKRAASLICQCSKYLSSKAG